MKHSFASAMADVVFERWLNYSPLGIFDSFSFSIDDRESSTKIHNRLGRKFQAGHYVFREGLAVAWDSLQGIDLVTWDKHSSVVRLLDEVRCKFGISLHVECRDYFYLWEKRENGNVLLCCRETLDGIREYLNDLLLCELVFSDE